MLFPKDTTDSCPADSQSSDRSVLWRKRQTLSRSTPHQPPESHPSPFGEGDGPLLNSAKEIEMHITHKDLGGNELAKFTQYIAEYLTEELDRAGVEYNIGRFMVEDAVSAYLGGAAEQN